MARNAKLNKFNLSHGFGCTMDPGYLYPVAFMECMPGDLMKIQDEFLIRFMPTIAPLMNRFKATLRWWYCPTRLLMEKWQDFITGGEDGQDTTVLPYVTAPSGGWPVGSLANRFRFKTGVAGVKGSAFPFRMYNLIWNEWYRAESVQQKQPVSLAAGADTTTNTSLLKVNWARDLFTDALPAPQKGPSIGLFGANSVAPVVGTGKPAQFDKVDITGLSTPGTNKYWLQESTGDARLNSSTTNLTTVGLSTDKTKSGLIADLSAVNDATINALRTAATIQQFQELNMRGGNRYVEFVYNHFGVRTPDASLQRPQLVGSFTSNIVISEVLQTSQTTTGANGSAQGTMAGHGIGAGISPVLKFRSLEHGYLMCLMSIQPDAIYYQGMPVELTRETRYDFAVPLLSHLGERGLKNKELFCQGPSVVDSDGNVVDEQVFGYVPRYEEYRRIPSFICGDLIGSLSFWTAPRTFANLPTLNSAFLECTPDTTFWAVQNGADHLVVQVMHHIPALRPLPKHGTPGIHIL